MNKQKQIEKRNRKQIFKISVFGIMRTLLLMGSLLLFLKDYKLYGVIGLLLYAVVLIFEKRFKKNNNI